MLLNLSQVTSCEKLKYKVSKPSKIVQKDDKRKRYKKKKKKRYCPESVVIQNKNAKRRTSLKRETSRNAWH